MFESVLATVTTITTITTALSVIAGSVFYLRYTATKANIEGKNETIATLEKRNQVIDDENKRLLTEVINTTSQNKILQGMATQTPEIIKLTESVTRLADGVAKQQKIFTDQGKQSLEMQIENTKLLKELVSSLKGK